MTDWKDFSLPGHFYRQASQWQERRDAGEPGIEAKLEEWLDADPRHRQAFAEAEEVLGEARIVPKGAAGFDGKLSRAPFYARQSTHIALGTAAALALAGVATVWTSGHLWPGFVTPAEAATYETGIGEIRTYRLEDASAVTLDTDTRIVVSQSGGRRSISILRGRIRVENERENAGYDLTAGDRTATVQGHLFDVILAGRRLMIAAPRDAIALEAAEPATGTPRQIASGSQIEIGSAGSAASVAKPDLEWVSGMLVLDGTRLDEAVNAINRYNRVKVQLASGDIGSRTLEGAFRANDPQGFAAAIGKMLGLHIDSSNPAKIALSRR